MRTTRTSILAVQRRRQQPGGDVHHGNYPVIRHPGRADDAQYAQHPSFHRIGRGHYAAFFQCLETGFLADENLYTVRVQALVKQMQ